MELDITSILAIASSCTFSFIEFVGLIIWNLRKYKKPLNSRIDFFSTIVFSGLAAAIACFDNSNNIHSGIEPATKPWWWCFLWAIFPLYMNVYLWNAARLFFISNLTDSHIQIQQQMEDREKSYSFFSSLDKEVKQAEQFAQSNWFVKHQNLVSNKFLSLTFVIINSILAIIFVVIGYVLWKWVEPLIFTAIFASLFVLYALFFLLVVFAIRKVNDGFIMKIEIIGISILWSFFAAAQIVEQFVKYSSSVLLIFVLFISFFFSNLLPIIRSFSGHQQEIELRELDSSTEDLVQSHQNELRTLKGILKNEKMRDTFTNFLKSYWKVQDIFFLQELEKFRSDSRLMAGRAVLIFQKFIQPRGFLDLKLPQSIIDPIGLICKNEDMLMKDGVIKGDFFDFVEQYVVDRLAEPLSDFKLTKEYISILKEEEKKERLNTGLRVVGVM